MNDIPGLNLLPEKYRALVMLLVVWFPLITRAVYRISQGGGLRSILAAFWLGTNTPSEIGKRESGNQEDRTLTQPINRLAPEMPPTYDANLVKPEHPGDPRATE